MAKFTCVSFENIRITLEVEAETPAEAMEIANESGWEDCEEETLGTDGVVEVLDASGKRVWLDGEDVPDGA